MTIVYAPNQGVVKLYLNGVLDASATPLAGGVEHLAETHVWLGISGNNDATLKGGIDEPDHEGASVIPMWLPATRQGRATVCRCSRGRNFDCNRRQQRHPELAHCQQRRPSSTRTPCSMASGIR